MARIRSLKPTIWQDEDFGEATHAARLLFIGLITQADDAGRMNGKPRLLWSLIFPWEDFHPDFLEDWLSELESRDLILRYEKNGKDYIALPGWTKHQKISHPTPSKLPPPPKNLRSDSGDFRNTEDSGTPHSHSANGHSDIPEDSGEPLGSSSFELESVGETIGKEGIGEERRG